MTNQLLAVVTATFKSTFGSSIDSIYVYVNDIRQPGNRITPITKTEVWEYIMKMGGISNANISYSPALDEVKTETWQHHVDEQDAMRHPGDKSKYCPLCNKRHGHCICTDAAIIEQ